MYIIIYHEFVKRHLNLSYLGIDLCFFFLSFFKYLRKKWPKILTIKFAAVAC